MPRVTRTEVDLALAGRMAVAAVERAREVDALVSVAVVDGGGHLLHFVRMDGAEVAGPVLAPDKAYTAVAHRAPTQRAEHRCPLSVANHAAASGKFLQGLRDRTDGAEHRRPVR